MTPFTLPPFNVVPRIASAGSCLPVFTELFEFLEQLASTIRDPVDARTRSFIERKLIFMVLLFLCLVMLKCCLPLNVRHTGCRSGTLLYRHLWILPVSCQHTARRAYSVGY